MALKVDSSAAITLTNAATTPPLSLTMSKSKSDSASSGVLNYVVASFSLATGAVYEQVHFEDISKVREVYISVSPVLTSGAITTFSGVSVSSSNSNTGDICRIAGSATDTASDGNGFFMLTGPLTTLWLANNDATTVANVTVVIAGLQA